MRDQLRIGSRVSWVVAWLAALAALVLSFLWPGDVMWWIGLALLLPLVGLAAWRQDKKGFGDDFYGGVGDGGPWGPPPS